MQRGILGWILAYKNWIFYCVKNAGPSISLLVYDVSFEIVWKETSATAYNNSSGIGLTIGWKCKFNKNQSFYE